MFRLTTRRRWI